MPISHADLCGWSTGCQPGRLAAALFVPVISRPVGAGEAKAAVKERLILFGPRDIAAALALLRHEFPKNIPLEGKLLCWRKAILTLGDHLLCHLERRFVEIVVFDQLLQESLLGFHLGFPVIGGAKAIVDGSHGPDLGGKEDIDKISSTAPARPRPCGGPRWRAAGIPSPPL